MESHLRPDGLKGPPKGRARDSPRQGRKKIAPALYPGGGAGRFQHNRLGIKTIEVKGTANIPDPAN